MSLIVDGRRDIGTGFTRSSRRRGPKNELVKFGAHPCHCTHYWNIEKSLSGDFMGTPCIINRHWYWRI